MTFEARAEALLLKNRRNHNGQQFTVPSPITYPYQWLWDSCFHAIALSHFDLPAAQAELTSLLATQFDNGMLPHMIFWKKQWRRPYFLVWESEWRSTITQPPMLAYALKELHTKNPDQDFLAASFEPTLQFYRYLIEHRDVDNLHLISIVNPDESGEDNCPRFDEAIDARSNISFFGHMYERNKLVEKNRACDPNDDACMKPNFWVYDVPFNAIMVRNLEALADLADILGRTEDKTYALTHARLIKKAMREHMLEDGIFWALDGNTNEKIKVTTWSHFVPLFAGLYSQAEAQNLIDQHFHNTDTLKSEYGIRTVSKQEESYRSHNFWRGPIWLAPQWFIFKGLQKYGFADEARWIRDTMRRNVDNSNFREYFNPETGKGLGAKHFTWGTLLLDMKD